MVLSRDLQRRAQIAAGAVSSLEEVPMRAWVVDTPGPIDTGPLVRIHRPTPVPGRGQVLVRVTCCGVCRTDLHLAEGDLPPHGARTVPGHEVVGVVDAVGPGSHRFRSENASACRGWLAPMAAASTAVVVTRTSAARRSSPGGISTAGMRTCVSPTRPTSTACRTRSTTSTRHPCCVPGSSAIARCAAAASHQAAGSASTGSAAAPTSPRRSPLHLGMRVHVLTRGRRNQELARRLGADSVGDAHGTPPEPLDGAILFAPAGELVPTALSALDRGGTLAVAGIWLSDIPTLGYDVTLFQERTLCSVTANTREDGEEFLALAERFAIRPDIVTYPMADAPRALSDLAHGRFSGAAVLCAD